MKKMMKNTMKSNFRQRQLPVDISKCVITKTKLAVLFLWHCIGSYVSLRIRGWRYEEAFLLTGTNAYMRKAVACWRLAARRGDIASMRNFGSCLATGNGCRKDMTRAMACYKAAAASGDVIAIHNIGACYSIGDGVPRDSKEAVRWLSQSAKRGFTWSVYFLGMHLCHGEGCDRDVERAFRCFRYAARRGIPNAQYDLAVCYANGEGVKRCVVLAILWLLLAALRGCDAASSIVEGDLLVAWLDGDAGLDDNEKAIKRHGNLSG